MTKAIKGLPFEAAKFFKDDSGERMWSRSVVSPTLAKVIQWRSTLCRKGHMEHLYTYDKASPIDVAGIMVQLEKDNNGKIIYIHTSHCYYNSEGIYTIHNFHWEEDSYSDGDDFLVMDELL